MVNKGVRKLDQKDRLENLEFNSHIYREVGELIFEKVIPSKFQDGDSVRRRIFKNTVYALFSNQIFRCNDDQVKKDDVDAFLAQLDELDSKINYTQAIYIFVLEFIGFSAFDKLSNKDKSEIFSVNQIEDRFHSMFAEFTTEYAEACIRKKPSKKYVKDLWSKLKDRSIEVTTQLKELKTCFSLDALKDQYSYFISKIVNTKLNYINIYEESDKGRTVINRTSLLPVNFSSDFHVFNQFLNNQDSLLSNHFAIMGIYDVIDEHGVALYEDIQKVEAIYKEIKKDFIPVIFYALGDQFFINTRSKDHFSSSVSTDLNSFSFKSQHFAVYFLHYLFGDTSILNSDGFVMSVDSLPMKSLFLFSRLVDFTQSFDLNYDDLCLVSDDFLVDFYVNKSPNLLIDDSISVEEESNLLNYLNSLKSLIEFQLQSVGINSYFKDYISFYLLRSCIFHISSFLGSNSFYSTFLVMNKGDQICVQNQALAKMFLADFVPKNKYLTSNSAFLKKAGLYSRSISANFPDQYLELNLLTGSSFYYVKDLISRNSEDIALNDLYDRYSSLEFLESVFEESKRVDQTFDFLLNYPSINSLFSVYSVFSVQSDTSLEFFLYENLEDLDNVVNQIIDEYISVESSDIDSLSNSAILLLHYFLNVLFRFKKIDSFTYVSLYEKINNKSQELNLNTYNEVECLRYSKSFNTLFDIKQNINKGFLMHILDEGINSENIILLFTVLKSLNYLDIFVDSILFKSNMEEVLLSLLDLNTLESKYVFRMLVFKILNSQVSFASKSFQSVFLKVYACKKYDQLHKLEIGLENAILESLEMFPSDMYEQDYDQFLDDLFEYVLRKSKCEVRLDNFDIDKAIESNSLGFFLKK